MVMVGGEKPERIIHPETCTPEQVSEQLRAGLVLHSVEYGGRTEPTPDEAAFVDMMAGAVSRLLHRIAGR